MNQLKRILEGLKPGETLTRVYAPEVRLLDKANRVFRFVASTRDIDSYNTRLIDWKYDRYMKNPVVLFSHNPFLPPVARTIKLADDGEKMRADIQFPPEKLYDFADVLFNLTEADFLRGVSVGFRHGRAQPNPEMKCVDLFENELNELSLVGLPSNPNALAEAMRSGAIPEQYSDLFIANKAAAIQNLRGVTDIDELKTKIEAWQKSDVIEVIEVRTPAEEIVEDETPPTLEGLLARCEELTTLSEELQAKADEKDDLIRVLQEDNAALRSLPGTADMFYLDHMRAIAAIVEYEVKPQYTKEELVELLSEVQGRCVRIGASLSKRNRDLLRSIINTVEEILGATMEDEAMPGEDPVPTDMDRSQDSEEPTADAEEMNKISERIKLLEKRMQAMRALDARELAEGTGSGKDDMLALIQKKLTDSLSGEK